MPQPKGYGPQRSPILGFPSIYAYTFVAELYTKFDVVTRGRWACIYYLGLSLELTVL